MKTISLKRILVVLAAFFTALLLLITPTVQASADETSDIRYTDVLEDLKRDKNFDESKYVAKADDYSLSVIHIAENKARELLIYVYRPSAGNEKYDCTARKISLSKTVGDDVDYSSYNLTLVDNSGVFDKYKVENFTTDVDSVRFYSISMISRKNYLTIDGLFGSSGGSIISNITYKSFKVGQFWRVSTVKNNTVYECEKLEVVIIDKKVVGHMRYFNGIFGSQGACDAQFVAFSCDHKIDDLLSAKVFYSYQDYRNYAGPSAIYNLPTSKLKKDEKMVYASDKGENNPILFFGKKYEWERISKPSDFLTEKNVENLNLSKGTKTDLEQMEWVLFYTETSYVNESAPTLGITDERYVKVSDVAILQLTFITDGVTYTMGVVDDYATPDDVPDGVGDTGADDIFESMEEFFRDLWAETSKALKIIAFALVVVLLGVLLFPFLPFIFKLLGTLVKWLLKGAWWLICFPWNLIGKLFKKKNKKNGDNQ